MELCEFKGLLTSVGALGDSSLSLTELEEETEEDSSDQQRVPEPVKVRGQIYIVFLCLQIKSRHDMKV